MDGFWPTFRRRPQTPPRRKDKLSKQVASFFDNPRRVLIPLKDDPATEFQLLISEGKTVSFGEKIGEKLTNSGKLAIRTTIPGEFKGVTKSPAPCGFYLDCAVIERTNEISDESFDLREFGYHPEELLREAGIPLPYEKLKRAKTLVMNLTQFDPYDNFGDYVLVNYPLEFIDGLQKISETFSLESVLLCVEKKNVDLLGRLEALKMTPNIRVLKTKKAYPERGYRLLLEEVVSKNGSDPNSHPVISDAWIPVCVSKAIKEGRPYVERLLRVDGSAIPEPRMLLVKIGTTLEEIFEFLRVRRGKITEVVADSILEGVSQPSMQVPVIHNTKLILAFSSLNLKESTGSKIYRETTCVRCAKCVDVCPANIVPNMIAESLKKRLIQRAIDAGLEICIECGLCAYVCPSRIPILTLVKIAKREIRSESEGE